MKARVAKPLSSNVPKPEVEMGRDAKYLESDPLRTEEELLLGRAGLSIFPGGDKFDPKNPSEQFDEWAKDLDAFLVTHRRNPAVRELVQKFLVDYINNPRNGVIPGDSSWSVPRKVSDWRDVYRLPRYYDLQGNLLRDAESGNPITAAPEKISGTELKDSPKMMVQLYGNLRNGMGFLELIKDGSLTGPKALAKTTSLRRQHLTIRLLEEGEHYLTQEAAPK